MKRTHGFALVVTLALLALLVLSVLALSVLVRVNAQMAGSSAARVEARENALLALQVAVAELQRTAGPDDRVTGMAGITGVAPQAGNSTRHWCGVWRADGAFIGWLASGAQAGNAALSAGTSAVELVGQATVGAAAANSEHVVAGRIPIPSVEDAAPGGFAWVVLDEGTKIPAYAPGPVGTAPQVFANATNAQSRLRDALANYAAALPKVSSYEQLALLPSPAAALTPSTLQDNFHHVTLANSLVRGAQMQAGFVNVNTTSVHVWCSLLHTYNRSPLASAAISAASVSSRGTSLQNNFAGFSAAGKRAGGPFTDLAAVSAFLSAVFPAGSPTATQVYAVLAPHIALRSDTFRVRAYGETANRADATRVEATAYVEAIVQRSPEPMPDGSGRRFVVSYFRWLGPGDI